MSTPVRRICDGCGLDYYWPCVEKDGVAYCCVTCAGGETCACPREPREHGDPADVLQEARPLRPSR